MLSLADNAAVVGETDSEKGCSPVPRIAEIKLVVARDARVHVRMMDDQSRRYCFSHPRQVAMYLARDMTNQSYPQIGRMFGNRDHTTVLYAYRKVCARMVSDEALRSKLDELRMKVLEEVARRPPTPEFFIPVLTVVPQPSL